MGHDLTDVDNPSIGGAICAVLTGAELIPSEVLFTLPCDVLVPAAVSGVINCRCGNL